MAKRVCSRLFIGIMLVAIYLPILVLAVYSFTDSANIGTIHGISFKNYYTLLTKQELTDMIKGTLFLAVGASVIATLLGTLGAIGVFYSKTPAKLLVGSLNQVPVVNADVVTGFSICILMIGVLGIDKSTYIPLVVGHVVLLSPFVYLAVVPKLKQMDNSLYEAALDLGASPFVALIKVVIPQIMPGILSGFALAFTLSLDDYFITTYTKPATFDTISTYVVNATKGSQTEIKTALWALSTIIFVVVIAVVLLMNMADIKGEKKSDKGLEAR
jgi:spermidine/putrescine transport system permease protein